MRNVLTLGLRLAWGTREQRLRSVAVAVASALGASFLLLIWAIARDRLLGARSFQSEVELVVAGTVLVVALPVVAMVATVARLQTRGREVRLANLRRLGLSAARTRLVAAVEVGVASATGVLLGIPLYSLLWSLVQRMEVSGQPWNPYVVPVPIYGWPLVLLGVPAVAILVAAWPPTDQDVGVDPDADRDDLARPGLWRLVPLVLGLVVCVWAVLHTFDGFTSDTTAYAVLAGVAIAGFGLLLAVPVLARLVADVGVKVARGPVTTIATRRLQARPGSVLRVVATLMAVLVVLGGASGVLTAFKDVPQYEQGKRNASQEQVADVTVSARDVTGIVASLSENPAVERVVDVPLVMVSVDGQDLDDETLLAAIATCADLANTGAGVPGCIDGRVLVGDSRPDLMAAKNGTVTPLTDVYDNEATGSPTATLDLSNVVTVPGRELGDVGVSGGVHLVIPPDTAGISEAVAVTDHQLLVYAPPGRALPTALDRAGIGGYTTYGTEDYDFTEGLFLLRGAVTVMLLLLGLFTVAIALVDRAAARRHENASLRALGTSTGVLRGAQFVEAVVPVLLGTVAAVLVGWLGGNAFLSLAEVAPVAVPWLLLAGTVIASFVVAGLTVVGIGSESQREDFGRT